MKALLAIILSVALAGCEAPEQTTSNDQCLRADLFQRCLTGLPAGPQTTQYNDWDEVVKACEAAAYYQSRRKLNAIKPECKI